MVNLIIAYVLIAVTLVLYGWSIYRRTRSVERSFQMLEEED